MTKKKVDLRILGLGDSELQERLHAAALAAGVQTLEELADLVIDSGVAARPPVDPLTERFTLEDLGLRLWTVATTTPRGRRRDWFDRLIPLQQKAVVTVLRARGYSPLAISNDFGIDPIEIEKIYAEHTTKLGAQVLAVRLDTLAGQIAEAKARAQQMAMEKDDHSTFWRIEKEFVGVMMDLGVVDRAAHRVEVVNKAEEAKAAALGRLVSLAEKRAARRAEIAMAQSQEVEKLPDAVEAEYEELKTG